MACIGLVANNVNLKSGECLQVQGKVAPGAKSFILNLGQDSKDLCLHFNPCFNAYCNVKAIVYNSRSGADHQEPVFPFQPGSVTEVCFFYKADLTVKLPDEHTFKFPNHLNVETMNYIAADDDFKIKCVAFE